MSLSENGGTNGFYMPVAPAYAGGFGGNSFGGGFGGDWGWIILLLLFAGGGWGNGFGGGNLGYDFPWLMTGQQNINSNTNGGFRDAMLNDGITSIRDGLNDLSAQICNSGFNTQTALLQGFNSLQAQQAQCCCDNRASIADLKYTVATEACADRSAVNEALRDVLAANTASTQRILDQLCADKIEQKNDTIAQLRSELLYARGQASQDVQTAAIQAGQRALANEVEQYVLPTPRPAYIVQNPNCCYTNTCGCGM